MKAKVFASSISALAVVTSGAGLAFSGWQNPFGEGEQIFNVSQRIENDDWVKAAIPLVLNNHFASSQIVKAGNRGEVGYEFEAVIADIYELPQPDTSEQFVDLAGTGLADEIKSLAGWQGTTLCSGEGIRKCKFWITWPPSAEGADNVVMVSVHLGIAEWGLIEESLLNELTAKWGAM